MNANELQKLQYYVPALTADAYEVQFNENNTLSVALAQAASQKRDWSKLIGIQVSNEFEIAPFSLNPKMDNAAFSSCYLNIQDCEGYNLVTNMPVKSLSQFFNSQGSYFPLNAKNEIRPQDITFTVSDPSLVTSRQSLLVILYYAQ